MKSYPRPVLQEFMTDFGFGGGTSVSGADRLIETISKSSEREQKEMLDKVLTKYFKISHDDLVQLLEKYNPEKLI